MDARVDPQTGTGERVVLAHCVGTRRVWCRECKSLFPRDDKKDLKYVFLTAQTRGRL